MFRALGLVIILIALSNFFSGAIAALDTAVTASLKTITVAAEVSRAQLQEAR